ncbi:hypothetical protein [Prescottella equi]
MRRPITSVIQGGLALAGVLALAGCSNTSPADEPATTTDSTSTTAVASTTPPVVVTDVDPARYETSPGWYHFYVDTTPRSDCAFTPGAVGNDLNVICSATFPDGTTPVTVPPFRPQPPNAVILTSTGYQPTVTESGPPIAERLAVNTRIVVGGAECTAVPGGFDCKNGLAGARFVDGQLALTGEPAATPSAAPTPSATTPPEAPMDHYTDGTTPVAPGTMCGAATGRRVVTVVSGTISCTDALAVMDTYRNLPAGDYGNANIREFNGWNCAAPTAMMARELGYGSRCSKSDTMLTTPVGAS